VVLRMKLDKRIFWSQCWLDYSYLRSQVTSQAAFARLLMTQDDFEPPRILRDWRSGRHSAHPTSVLEIDKRLPERTSWLYFLPIVQLLTPRKWTVPYVRGLLAPYCIKTMHGELTWKFPNDAELAEQGGLTYIRAWDDTTRLYERGDICGFMAILGLLRYAEARGDIDRHCTYSRDLYRAIPAIAREPWLRPRIDVLLELIERVLCRMVLSTMAFRIKWNVMREQILAPNYEPNPALRTVDPATGRVNIPEDLIFELPISGYLPAYKRPVPLLTGVLELEEDETPKAPKLDVSWMFDPDAWMRRRRAKKG
jgi:hypothetical protein